MNKKLIITVFAAYISMFPALSAFAQAPAEVRELQNLRYEYDALGNITRVTDTSETNTAKEARYEYDDLSRLIEAATENAANGDDYNQTYTYSPTGNIIRNSAVGEYSYDGTHPQAATGAGDTRYTYDAKGNLTGDGTWQHAYDYRNRLIQSTNGDKTLNYEYDHGSERVKKTDGESATIYVSEEYEIEDGVPVIYVFADGTRVARIQGGIITWYHADHLTGANASTDEAGQLTELADYYPYGEDRVSESTDTPMTYRFTDQEKDFATGLYYYGARYYNPVIGRFLSLDPWQGDPADPQSLNKYSYVRNNPLKYIDPNGENAVEAAIPFAGALVFIDGILPIGDAIALIILIGAKIYDNTVLQNIPPSITDKPLTTPANKKAGNGITTIPQIQNQTPATTTIPAGRTGQSNTTVTPSGEIQKTGCGGNVTCTDGRSFKDLLNDINNNPNNWEGVNIKKDPKQPKDGISTRETWQNKQTGERIEKHVLEKKGKPSKNHPHFKPKNK